VPPENSLTLDYISPLSIQNFLKAFKLKAWAVLSGLIGFGLLKLAVSLTRKTSNVPGMAGVARKLFNTLALQWTLTFCEDSVVYWNILSAAGDYVEQPVCDDCIGFV
jgi:hypothetical protein